MARPYSAGGVSIAQSNPTCRRPAAPWPRAAFQNQRAYLPQMFPAPSLLFPTAHLTDWGPGERVRERGRDLEALSPAFAFLKEDFMPMRHEKAERHRFCCVGKSR
jgi:hypothetical protein